MKVLITSSLVLKGVYLGSRIEFMNSYISPGTYILEEKRVYGEKWLFLKGRHIGQSVEFWKSWSMAIVQPQCSHSKSILLKKLCVRREVFFLY